MSYGHITSKDAEAIELAILHVWSTRKGKLHYLEIGPFGGSTVGGVRTYCEQNSIPLDVWGVDVVARAPANLFGPGQYIIAPSEEAWQGVQWPKEGFDMIFVDGCHCINHVALDALHYGRLVRPAGLMLFHDVVRNQQHVMKNEWVHQGDKPVHRTAVLDALELIGWPNPQWRLFGEFCDQSANFGGIQIWIKNDQSPTT